MTLQFCTDVTAADWIVQARVPWEQQVVFGPAGFPAYARLRYLPDPSRPGQLESDVSIGDDHPSDFGQARRALDLLAGFTGTPEDCYFCVWDGRSDVHFPPSVLAGPMVVIPHRRYYLLAGSVTDLDNWGLMLGGSENPPPPSFGWPADHSWCFVNDVDPHWAGIGAGQDAIDALLADPGLDVVPAVPTERQPTYY